MPRPSSLRALIDAQAPLRPARAIQITLQILEALGPIHAQGRAHGDVRPECVAVRQSHIELGSPANARGSMSGDLRDTGAILYELLTRATPNGSPVSSRTPAVLPAQLDGVIARALDASSTERFDSAARFAHELRVCLLDALSTARRSLRPPQRF